MIHCPGIASENKLLGLSDFRNTLGCEAAGSKEVLLSQDGERSFFYGISGSDSSARWALRTKNTVVSLSSKKFGAAVEAKNFVTWNS